MPCSSVRWQGLTYKGDRRRDAPSRRQRSRPSSSVRAARWRTRLPQILRRGASAVGRGRRATPNSGVAAIGSLIVGGSVKVAATVATVAATSVVTVTPGSTPRRHQRAEPSSGFRISRRRTRPSGSRTFPPPVVALAQQLTSVKPAPQPPKRRLRCHTHVSRRERPALRQSQRSPKPSGTCRPRAAAATPAVAPTPHNPPSLVPVPAPATCAGVLRPGRR